MGLFDVFLVIRQHDMKVIALQFHVKFQKGERMLFFGDAVNCYYSVQTMVGELNMGFYRW